MCPARRVIKERESRHGGSGGALTVILVTLVRLNMLRVAVSDFPVYDGSVPPDEFITRCRRLAALGGIPAEQLSAIITVQCRGLAFKALEGDHGQTDVPILLQKTFGDKQPGTAAVQLSTARKGSMSVLDYSVLIQQLVRDACPEFFDESGMVKKICVPSHQATLYRHFLVGLSSEERVLLSRQGAKSFEAAVDELKREEAVSSLNDDECRRSRGVRWAENLAVRGACGGGLTSSRRDLSPAAPPAWGEPRGSASCLPRGDRSLSPRGPEWGQDETAAAWRRRGESPSARSPDRGDIGAGLPPHRRRSRDCALDDWGRRPPSPAGGRGAGRSDGQRRGAGGPRDRPSARERRSAELAGERRREVQCWSCRGFGHLKRHCPNGQLGRPAGEW